VPQINGRTTPPKADQNATLPTWRHHHEIGFEPGDKQQEKDSNLCEVSDDVEQRGGTRTGESRKDRPRENVEHCRAEDEPDQDLTEHRWLAQAAAQRSGGLRRGNADCQQQDDLQGVAQGGDRISA